MKSRYLTLLATLILLGYSAIVAAHPCDRDPDYNNHKHCFTDPNPDPEPAPEYTAALTVGGFRFGPVDVTPNNRDTGFTSTLSLDMSRPSDAEGAQAWDDVFLTCYDVLDGTQITGITVGTDWGITQGGKKKSNWASNIRITFRTVVADNFPEVDLWISVFNWADFWRADFYPPQGSTSLYTLDTAKIYGDVIGSSTSCNSGEFGLSEPTQLEICHKYEDGSGCE